MKIENLTFILFCVCFSWPQTHQIISQKFKIDYTKNSSPIQFDELLFNSLDFLQQKLTHDTFTNEDLRRLGIVMKYVYETKENIKKRKMKEQTVYWLSRQGR